LVFLYAHDFSAHLGTGGRWSAKKILRMMDLAYQSGSPVIGLNHSAGARFEEMGGGDLGGGYGFAQQFYKIAHYSGAIPQISLMMGDNAGGGVYGPGMTDFILATKQSNLFMAGPALVKSVIGEEIGVRELGGAGMHASVSGVVHVLTENDEDCIKKARELLSFLPSNCREVPPVVNTGDDPKRLCPELNQVVPVNHRVPFDMHEVIKIIVDSGHFFEIHRDYARNIIVGFARFNDHTAAIIASNSLFKAGAVTVDAAEKAARFIRFSDAFNIPLVYLLDSPAYMVGSQQERAGLITRGTKLIYATAEATVPKITVLIRKALGASSLAMGSQELGGDVVYAWPIADMSGLSPESVADIVYQSEIRQSPNPEETRRLKVEQCRKELGDIYAAASWQNVNDMIEPAETRMAIIRALEMTRYKVKTLPLKKHSNIPL
ncbi:MAG: carboxyl transferase domain-containing protein, partial [Dehalococcoidia bacterium]|nr:carboxyl transferase domain-containing protein [Dehalococcoidia bacterium]